jgi:hypothetical protein
VKETKVSAGDQAYPNVFAIPSVMSLDAENLGVTRDYQAEDEAKMIEAGKRKAAERNAEAWNQLVGLSEENHMTTHSSSNPIDTR